MRMPTGEDGEDGTERGASSSRLRPTKEAAQVFPDTCRKILAPRAGRCRREWRTIRARLRRVAGGTEFAMRGGEPVRS